MASWVRKAIAGYAAGQGTHGNNVTLLVGSPYSRLRVGDFRVIFQEDATTILVLKIRPRGGAYD
jgi:mRNA interferase RelE/StbE